ncbi:MAG: TIGR01212 family radical SAM protein [Bacteroidota bacterium]
MKNTWGNNRRYNSYSHWCKEKFGSRIQKVSVIAGFTCPNRDGTLGVGGCSFCNNLAFNPAFSYSNDIESLHSQIDKGLDFLKKRYKRSSQFVAYLQAYTNTYADLESLKNIYENVLSHKEISGLVIGTRPDCIDKEKLSYLKELSKDYFISVEYGVESCYDKTLKRINRGHNFESSKKAIEQTADMGIHVGAHFILGLPGESKAEMLNQIPVISELPLNSIKFHQLQIVRDTKIAEEYSENPEKFYFFELAEYVDFLVDIIERLNPNIAIERISGEVPPRFNLGKRWGMLRSDQIITMLEKRLEERDTFQGKLYGKY